MKKLIFLFLSVLFLLNIENTEAKVEGKVTSFLNNWYCYTFYVENDQKATLSSWKIDFFIPQTPNVYQTWNWDYKVLWDNQYQIISNNSTWSLLSAWWKIETWFCATNTSIQPTNIRFSFLSSTWSSSNESSSTTQNQSNNTNQTNNSNTSNLWYALQYFNTEKKALSFSNNSLNIFQEKLDRYIENKISNLKNYKLITYYRNWFIKDLKDFEDKKITSWKLKARIKIYTHNLKLFLK